MASQKRRAPGAPSSKQSLTDEQLDTTQVDDDNVRSVRPDDEPSSFYFVFYFCCFMGLWPETLYLFYILLR